MLKLALKARLPLITATTADPANVERVLRHIAGQTEPIQKFQSVTDRIAKGSVWYRLGGLPKEGKGNSPEKVVQWFTGANSTLVLVNVKGEPPPGAYDAGGIPTPSALVERELSAVVDEKVVAALMPVLGGLTLQEVFWAVALAGAKHRAVMPGAIADIRRTAFPPGRGLALVGLDMTGYVREHELEAWLETRAPFFLSTPDPRLRPRGVLLDGPPGTGKTFGAKFLAVSLGVPLYRLAMDQVKHKYVGDSERNLAQALAQLDYSEPCVLLIDEMEKLFAEQNDSGVTSNLLAALLWWLEEHESRVLTVMTTNNKNAIPDEARRKGRVDSTLRFEGVKKADAESFLRTVGGSYDCAKLTADDVSGIIDRLYAAQGGRPLVASQASLVDAVAGAMRAHLLRPRKRRADAVRVHRKRS